MKLSSEIDLGRSLRQVFGGKPGSESQVEADRDRQTQTAEAILERFFTTKSSARRELVLLADEVGLGKTYVALAAAVSILDAIRLGNPPEDQPANKPAVLILTPANDALFNKWLREAEAFKRDCAREGRSLDWLEILKPVENTKKSGNILGLTRQLRKATRSRPVLLIAKLNAFGAAIDDREDFRRRSLAVIFDVFRIRPDDRRWWCRHVLGSGSQLAVPELLDLRKSKALWDDAEEYSPDLEGAYRQAIQRDEIRGKIQHALDKGNADRLIDLLDDLTRHAVAVDWPSLSLVVIDEVHGLKNKDTQARRNLESYLKGKPSRLLGLSATPFQLRHDELLSVVDLRSLLALRSGQVARLDSAVERLSKAIKGARSAGDRFRKCWLILRPSDRDAVHAAWGSLSETPFEEAMTTAAAIRPQRVARALEAAVKLRQSNVSLQEELGRLVIRHRHLRGYREHFVGRAARAGETKGSAHFAWMPGLEVNGSSELAHYLMMRSVALAKDEKGLPGLGAELTGSYRHLVETSAVWRKLAQAKNPLLLRYRSLLQEMIGHREADTRHCKVQATVQRVMELFKLGQKSLVFCVYTKTAETIRDQIQAAVDQYLHGIRDPVFDGDEAFENFRRRFFNRHEPLFSLIQDQPLLGRLENGSVGVPEELLLDSADLRRVCELLVERGARPDDDKPDRRQLLAAAEQVAVRKWRDSAAGNAWLAKVCGNCEELLDKTTDSDWLTARDPLSRSARAVSVRAREDLEARREFADPLDTETQDDAVSGAKNRALPGNRADVWFKRLGNETIGETIAPYFQRHAVRRHPARLPLLAQHHSELLAEFALPTRVVAGQVFRRILMAEEFLLRYLADAKRQQAERWVDYLADSYTGAHGSHLESLRDRVTAYLETLSRARQNQSLLEGYYAAAENRNVVQLVQGGTVNRDRYFLGFNTPYRPEILISTSVGQEGIDLHRECRHIIHHDLCWNPATIEQRTGRVDRIGSKVERERVGASGADGPSLEIAVPYLAATYDERMFEELYRRAQLFEVTMGGDVRVEGSVEGRIDLDDMRQERRRREKAGIGTEDEDLGEESATGTVDLPASMVEKLRVDLSVWKPVEAAQKQIWAR